jgi:hypothetical protein
VEKLKILFIYEKSILSPKFGFIGLSSALLTVPVRMSPSFGLCSPSITCSCPNQLLIQTLFSFYPLFLSESPLLSDSALLLSPIPVQINSSFRLCSPSIPCSCPNQLLIQTLFSFYHLFLSVSSLHSDSVLLLSPSPIPVRINSSFGLCSPSITCSCPNHLFIRTPFQSQPPSCLAISYSPDPQNKSLFSLSPRYNT